MEKNLIFFISISFCRDISSKQHEATEPDLKTFFGHQKYCLYFIYILAKKILFTYYSLVLILNSFGLSFLYHYVITILETKCYSFL